MEFFKTNLRESVKSADVLKMNFLEKLKAQRWNTVAVIDDSQIFPTGLITNIRSLASEKLKVIIGTTDPKGERQEAVRAAAIVAVESLVGRSSRSLRSRRSLGDTLVRWMLVARC